MSERPLELLRSVFGYREFRPLQAEIIHNVLEKQDTLAVMPTGGGKSLCYQLPALIFSGLTVVVSPLISLMKDQVEQLDALGVPALFLNSSLEWEQYQTNASRVRSGQVKLLYVAPETLLTPRMIGLLSGQTIDCLTVDEAHCISHWGHDFRPEYRKLAAVRERFPDAVCLALTATATPRVRQDIHASLALKPRNRQPCEFIASFDRPNLLIEVASRHSATNQALALIRRFPRQSGIIYCFSRKQVDKLALDLQQRGVSARPYHAGLSDEERRANQEAFIHDEVQIIVATVAFGMGINKPNVRFIIHFDLPQSLEGYYQEIGRAGRDGERAHCLLLYSYSDAMKVRFFIDQKEGEERKAAEARLQAMIKYADNDRQCRRIPLLAHFGETYRGNNCGMCDVCLSAAAHQEDLTIPVQKLLSCAIRTGERFGSTHLVDVLLGEVTDKVEKFGHQQVSTFGIGKELSRERWMRLATQLKARGLFEETEHHGLQVSEEGREFLRTRQSYVTSLPAVREAPVQAAAPIEQYPHDQALLDRLFECRRQIAQRDKVPAYVIFPDRTLMEMATFFPQSLPSLRQMHGMGDVKLEKYGAPFLENIIAYCKAKGLAERPYTVPKGRRR